MILIIKENLEGRGIIAVLKRKYIQEIYSIVLWDINLRHRDGEGEQPYYTGKCWHHKTINLWREFASSC